MSKTPQEFYFRIERRLSPMLREVLAEYLPKAGGRGWWNALVVANLSALQRENLRDAGLEQFDFPALVALMRTNWSALKRLSGTDDLLCDYLEELKTFRNHSLHMPDLVITSERRRHLEHSAGFVERILIGLLPERRRRRARMRLLTALAFMLAVSVSGWGALQVAERLKPESERAPAAVVSGDPLQAELELQTAALLKGGALSPESMENCSVLRFVRDKAMQHASRVDVGSLFKEELSAFERHCSGSPKAPYPDYVKAVVLHQYVLQKAGAGVTSRELASESGSGHGEQR